MKLYGHRHKSEMGGVEVKFYVEPITYCDVVGTIEVDPPKKTVVKEANVQSMESAREAHQDQWWTFKIPVSAENIKCTYEVEE